MSIVKMKRLRLLAMQSDQEELLQRLQRLGCVEIDQPDVDLSAPEWAGLSRPDGAALNEARDAGASASAALEALKQYAPAKGGLLKGRPVIPARTFFDDGAFAAALETAGEINQAQRTIQSLYAQQSKLGAQKAALAPWLPLDIPLDTPSTQDVSVQFGTIPGRLDLNEAIAALGAAAPLAQLMPSSSDSDAHYVLLICHASQTEAALTALKDFGFSAAPLKGWSGTAAENDQALDAELERTAAELEATRAVILSKSDQRQALERCLDRANQEIRRQEARSRLLDTGAAFYLDGWLPAERVDDLARTLDGFICAWETADPTPEEYPNVPVQLKNNWFTRPLSMVTEMYSLPAYDGVDPNPLMAPFFILFYGIMMADMGYGLLMMIASVVVSKKTRPRGTMGHLIGLLGLCGVSTFFFGALTGGFFGDFLTQLVSIVSPGTEFALPSLFTPLDDTLMILVGAMILGFIQIITGMAISFVKKLRDGKVMDAVWEELTWWIVFAGLGLAILGVTPIVLVIGGVMVLVGSGWNAKGFGKVGAVFGSLYNHVTGYFGDILSYSRLMALMLAGSVIAQVFNILGAIPGNIVIFLIISLAGNALNFALNLLSCYVHDLRLQCLEYFNKFYQDGGRPFKPLEINTKYVDITENN